MSKFLDGFGVDVLWKKIKSLFGETFVEKNGTINVLTPVKGAISQNEFNMLSEEEKKHGLYIVRGTVNKIVLNGESFELNGASASNGASIYISSEKPKNMKPGDIWFKEVE